MQRLERILQEKLYVKDPQALVVLCFVTIAATLLLATPETLRLVAGFAGWQKNPLRLAFWLLLMAFLVWIDFRVVLWTVWPKYLTPHCAKRAALTMLAAILLSATVAVYLRHQVPAAQPLADSCGCVPSAPPETGGFEAFQAGGLLVLSSFSLFAFIHKWTTPALLQLDYSKLHRSLAVFLEACHEQIASLQRDGTGRVEPQSPPRSWLMRFLRPLREARDEAERIRDIEHYQEQLAQVRKNLQVLCDFFESAYEHDRTYEVERFLDEYASVRTQTESSVYSRQLDALHSLQELMTDD